MDKDIDDILLNKCNVSLSNTTNKSNLGSPEFPVSMMEKSDVSPENSKKSDISSSSDNNPDSDGKTKLEIIEQDKTPQYQQFDNKSFDKNDKLVTMVTTNQQKTDNKQIDNPHYQQQYQHQNNNDNSNKQVVQQQSLNNISSNCNEIIESNDVQSNENILKNNLNKSDSVRLMIDCVGVGLDAGSKVNRGVNYVDDDDDGVVELRHPGANNSVDSLDNNNDCNVNDTNKVNQNLAFTIDFGNNSNINTQKHKSMLERFQNRHKRGVSLSKLEDHANRNNSRSVSVSHSSSRNLDNININLRMKPPMSAKLPRKKLISVDSNTTDESVVLRVKDKSSARTGESSKRHSWSPRSSLHETQTKGQFVPRSTAVIRALEVASAASHVDYESFDSNTELHSLDSSNSFTCPVPDLENSRNSDGDDDVSDAGTYTIPDNNYTKEQKERMDIDKLGKGEKLKRPNHFVDEILVIDLEDLNTNTPTKKTPEKSRKNVLEVSYCLETATNLKPKISYLDKIKSRFQRSTKSPDKQLNKVPDLGTFTSVTTGGIFSSKPVLENHPRMTRRNSLTKSQIDNSEYVQGISKLNLNIDEKISNHPVEKYRDENEYGDISVEIIEGANDADYDGCDMDKSVEYNQRSAIKTAKSKKDWVMEWAENVREYSRNSNRNNSNNKMTRSYTTESNNANDIGYDNNMSRSDYYESKYEEEFGDNLDKHHFNKILARYNTFSDDVKSKSNRQSKCEQLAQNNFNIPVSANPGFNNNFTHVHNYNHNKSTKPPISPLSPMSRIPSPIHSIGRGRSVSRNRSLQGSNSDLSGNANDTEMYLQKTAAAISSLQNIHRRNSLRNSSLHNSPLSPMSPSHNLSPKLSPMHSLNMKTSSPQYNINQFNNQYSPERHSKHKRNLSFDNASQHHNKMNLSGLQHNHHNNNLNNPMMSNSLNSDNLNKILDNKRHTRHNSYEGMSIASSGIQLPPKPVKCFTSFDQTNYNEVKSYYNDEDYDIELHNKGKLQLQQRQQQEYLQQQQMLSIKQNHKLSNTNNNNNNNKIRNTSLSNNSRPIQNSPIKRSTSFSSRPTANLNYPSQISSSASKNFNIKRNSLSSSNSKNPLQKSASSSSFKKLVINYDDESEFYINDQDDLEPNPDYSFNSSDDEIEIAKDPIANTRYNKTVLMRMEQNKSKINNSSATTNSKQGVFACPNTPEMPRRGVQMRQSTRDRASMPRDSSLNRMKQDLSNRKTVLTKDSARSSSSNINDPKRIQPKYMDISKYKTNQGQNFLKRDETKSYLPNKDLKKSPSSATITTMNRNDGQRSSVRAKSSNPKVNKKEIISMKKIITISSFYYNPHYSSIDKQKTEQELEMWRRRSSYDPMKAAAEGKKKQDEARRMAMLQQQHQQQQQIQSNERFLS